MRKLKTKSRAKCSEIPVIPSSEINRSKKCFFIKSFVVSQKGMKNLKQKQHKKRKVFFKGPFTNDVTRVGEEGVSKINDKK